MHRSGTSQFEEVTTRMPGRLLDLGPKSYWHGNRTASYLPPLSDGTPVTAAAHGNPRAERHNSLSSRRR